MENKFIWYGLNKQFNNIVHSHAMTTIDLLEGKYPSWMALKNRGEDGNCKFLAECFFTGQKDKNGKEVFEGDILKNPNGKIDKVIWTENGFYGRAKHPTNKNRTVLNPLCKDYLENKEVVGNIYENPELLSTPTAVL